jgi:cytochrome c553
MQKKRLWISVLVLSLILLSTMVVAKQDALKGLQGTKGQLIVPLGDITLTPPQGVKQKATEVKFSHSGHFTYACTECHHEWKGEEFKNCTTSGCHNRLDSPQRPVENGAYTKEAITYYKYAYHNQCRGCHKEQKAGPVKCFDCHPKKGAGEIEE